jgi:hypothetical protein
MSKNHSWYDIMLEIVKCKVMCSRCHGEIKHGDLPKRIPRYEGEVKDGKIGGHGVLTLGDGTRYEGEFKDGKKGGHGVETLGRWYKIRRRIQRWWVDMVF